jgi:predicted nucleic acid-binding protein
VSDSPPQRGLIDTSVLIASETSRPLREDVLPLLAAVSAVTVAELHLGVLAAPDESVRAVRLATLADVFDIEVIPVDESVAASWALLRVHLASLGRRLNVNDLWIAATALAHDLPIVTQDADFDPIDGVAGVTVIRV